MQQERAQLNQQLAEAELRESQMDSVMHMECEQPNVHYER